MTTLADALSMPLAVQASSATSAAASSSSSTATQPLTTASSSTPSDPQSQSQSASTARNPPVFEFTKRKRWADLLVTELSEAIILVLSPQGKVWYCGAAVAELLGWKDEDVVDREFSEYVNRE